MGNQVLGWADLAVDVVEVAALIVVLLLLFRVHRIITTLVQVIRRMDRKIVGPTIHRYRLQAEPNEAGLQWTGDLEQKPDQPAAD